MNEDASTLQFHKSNRIKTFVLVLMLVVVFVLVSVGLYLVYWEISGFHYPAADTGTAQSDSPLDVSFILQVEQLPEEIFEITLLSVKLQNRTNDPEFCLEEIQVIWDVAGTEFSVRDGRSSLSGTGYISLVTFEDFCNDKTVDSDVQVVNFRPDGTYFAFSSQEIGVNAKDITVDYRKASGSLNTDRAFPLDGRQVRLFVSAKASQDNSMIYLLPSVHVFSYSPSWRAQFWTFGGDDHIFSSVYTSTSLYIDYRRPMSIRFLTVFLFIFLFFFMAVLPFVTDTGSALQVSIAILLGLWGVQTALVPSDISAYTLIDTGILVLYMFFALFASIRFIGRPVLALQKSSRPKGVSNKKPTMNEKVEAEQAITLLGNNQELGCDTSYGLQSSGPNESRYFSIYAFTIAILGSIVLLINWLKKNTR